ncbi:MAG: cupredoxin domain-containing protein [Acidimicrobiales bacterium]
MFRGTAPRLTLIALITAIAVYVAVPAQAAAEHRIRVSDSAFNPVPADVEAGDTVVWELLPSAQLTHTVTSEDGLFRAVLTPGSASTEFRYTFNTAGKYTYFCENHLQSNFMAGQVRVVEPPPPPTTTTTTEPPPTTTTTEPPPTTTTTVTAPPPTTTTTRPRATTTTTRPPATSPTTGPPASASDDDPATTDTTARATTTSGKPTTTTTGKKKPGPTTTTRAPETTTSSTAPALPAEWIPTPDIVPDDSPTTSTTSPDTEAAASHRPTSPRGKGGGGFPVPAAAALGLLVLGGAVWVWYHRSSRYLPA